VIGGDSLQTGSMKLTYTLKTKKNDLPQQQNQYLAQEAITVLFQLLADSCRCSDGFSRFMLQSPVVFEHV